MKVVHWCLPPSSPSVHWCLPPSSLSVQHVLYLSRLLAAWGDRLWSFLGALLMLVLQVIIGVSIHYIIIPPMSKLPVLPARQHAARGCLRSPQLSLSAAHCCLDRRLGRQVARPSKPFIICLGSVLVLMIGAVLVIYVFDCFLP